MFYYLGLLLVLVSWAGGAFLLTKWRNKDFLTISKHAASNIKTYLLFLLVVVGVGGLFQAWAMRYITPKMSTATAFTVLVWLSFSLQYATAIIPDVPGRRRQIHRYTAWGMAVSWLPLAILVGFSAKLSPLARIVCLLGPAYSATTLYLVLAGKVKGHFLALQALYVVSFQISLLAAVYL